MRSQNEMILRHLEQGNKLNPLEALQMFGCFRLGARIHDLKQLGYSIDSNIVKSGHKRYAEYYMSIKEKQLCF